MRALRSLVLSNALLHKRLLSIERWVSFRTQLDPSRALCKLVHYLPNMLWFVSYTFVPLVASTSAFSRVLLRPLFYMFAKHMENNTIDPVTGLSIREKRLVRKSWALVKKDARNAGIGFFMALFEAHPAYLGMFKAFSNVTDKAELAKNSYLHAHAMNVMNTVNFIVESLDQVPTLVAILKRVARSHGKRGITDTDFENVSNVLVNFLGSVLGKKHFTEDCRKSWIHTLDVAVSVIKGDLIN